MINKHLNRNRVRNQAPGNHEPGNQDSGSQNSGHDAFAADLPTDPAVMTAVERAFAHPPVLHIPADFAARVVVHVVPQAVPQDAYPHPSRHASRTGFGPGLALASGLLLTGALFALAPQAAPSFANLRFDLELLLLTELGGIGFLLTQIHVRG